MGALAVATVCGLLLWLTCVVSNELDGGQSERQEVRLVTAEGQLFAFDRGQHPAIDGWVYRDPAGALATIEEWKRAGARAGTVDRARALPVAYEDPGHEWWDSFDSVVWRSETARIEPIGLTLPWLTIETLEYRFGNFDRTRSLAESSIIPTGPSHPAVAYLREHASWSEMADRLAEGVHSYPHMELDKRFLWILVAQATLVIGLCLSVLSSLRSAWRRLRGGAPANGAGGMPGAGPA